MEPNTVTAAGLRGPGEKHLARPAINVNGWLDGSKFNSFHLMLFFLGLSIVTCDGYDLFVYGAALPLLMRDFHLSPAQAGMLASAAAFGALVGSFGFGPFADKYGRRNTLLLTTALFSASMGLTAFTHTPGSFAVLRFLTGMGAGGSMPNMAALASEYVPRRSRALVIAGLMSGMQVGSIVAALLGIWTFQHYGWRAVFLLAAVPLLLLPVYAKYLPESPTYLVKNNRLEQARTWLHKARPDDAMPADAMLQVEADKGKVPLAAIMQEGRAYSSIVFWIMFFMNLYVIYGFVIWLPKLVMSRGYSLATGLSSLLTLSIGSIAGSFLAGYLADRFGNKKALVGAYIVSFASVAGVAFTGNFWMLMGLVTLAGAGFNGAQNSVQAYVAPYYPPSMRSTGLSMCYALGRLGGMVGPGLIGVLMSWHFSYQATIVAIALPALIPAIGVLTVPEKYNFARQVAAQKELVVEEA